MLRRSILLASGAMMLGSMELPALARKLPAPKGMGVGMGFSIAFFGGKLLVMRAFLKKVAEL